MLDLWKRSREDQIETTLDQLRQFRREKLETIREIEDEIEFEINRLNDAFKGVVEESVPIESWPPPDWLSLCYHV